ncbi:hypothetical protein ACO0OL_004026 [Hanseniaspora opuntiae]
MVGINENIRSDNSQEALQSDHDQGSINVAINHKSNDVESSSVSLSLSTIIHDKVPKNLDAATQEARLVSFVIVYEKGNVIILGRYSENSINTIGQKFSATSLNQVCLRIFKADNRYEAEKSSGGSGKLVTTPPSIMAYSFEELTFIKNSIVSQSMALPGRAGVYLITTCTKKRIKLFQLNSFDGIRKVATLNLLERYFEDVAQINSAEATSTVVSRLANNSKVNSEENAEENPEKFFEETDVHPANDSAAVFSFLTYRDKFVSRYVGNLKIAKVNQERAYNLINELISCEYLDVLSYYFVSPNYAPIREINAVWAKFAVTPFFKEMYPTTYNRRQTYRANGYVRAAKNAVFKEMFGIINHLEEHLSRPTYENGNKSEFTNLLTLYVASANTHDKLFYSLGNANISNTAEEVTRRTPLTNRLSNTTSSLNWHIGNYQLYSNQQQLAKIDELNQRVTNLERRLLNSNNAFRVDIENTSTLREMRALILLLQEHDTSTRQEVSKIRREFLKFKRKSRTRSSISTSKDDINGNESH